MLGGQGAWTAHAAAVYARVARQQIHVQRDWLFSLCIECGWSLELDPHFVYDFRYSVATHDCSPEDIPEAAAVPVLADVLF